MRSSGVLGGSLRSARASRTSGLNYTGHLGGGPLNVVIDHFVGGQAPCLADLLARPSRSGADLLGRIAAGFEPLLLHLGRGRHEEDDAPRRGAWSTHLAGALDVDLQQDVAPRRGLRDRGAVG